MIKNFFHWLSHVFKSNNGKVVTWMEDNTICIGFECSGCGYIDPKTIDRVLTSDVIPTDEKWMNMKVAEE